MNLAQIHGYDVAARRRLGLLAVLDDDVPEVPPRLLVVDQADSRNRRQSARAVGIGKEIFRSSRSFLVRPPQDNSKTSPCRLIAVCLQIVVRNFLVRCGNLASVNPALHNPLVISHAL